MIVTNPLTQQPLTDSDLEALSALANKLLAVQAEMGTLEVQLKNRAEMAKNLEFTLIPEAMSRIGMTKFVLSNGVVVEVAPYYACYLSEEEPELKTRGIAWLRANKYASLVKNEIKVNLDSDSNKESLMIQKYLDKHGIQYAKKEMVHPSTLKSLMRELIESGKNFPMDIFRAITGKRAKLTNN